MADSKPVLRRLWRPRVIAAVALPLVVVVAIAIFDHVWTASHPLDNHPSWPLAVHYAAVIVAALVAIYAVNAFRGHLNGVLDEYLGLARARAFATFVSFILYCLIILVAISNTVGNLNGLLVGGALTGVIVGIAGQATLANLIAGLVILFARPYSAGMYLTVRAGVFGGVEYSGQVWDISLFYTTLHSGGHQIRVPNSTMVAAVVVLRPQQLDVYIPITFPPAADLPAVQEALRRVVAGATAARRSPEVVLERVTELGYIVGVRVFVAGEGERRAVERAIGGVVREQQAVAARSAAPAEGQAPEPADAAHAAAPGPVEGVMAAPSDGGARRP